MNPKQDEVTLVAGAQVYASAVPHVRGLGYRVYVCYWREVSPELRGSADRFLVLITIRELLQLVVE